VPREPESLVVTLDTGDRLHYLDWGPPAGTAVADSLPVLLVHGIGQTAWAWAPICRRLAEAAHLLAPDLRGHGLSDSPRTGYELDSLAFDVLTVLSAAGYGDDVGGRPAVLVGHGLGAMVAATMATLRPRSVAALALVDGGWEQLSAATGQDAAELVRSLGDPPEVLASMEAYLDDRRGYDPSTWDADQERAARAAVDEKHAGHVAPVTRAHALRGAAEAMFAYDPATALSGWTGLLLVAVAESGSADDDSARARWLALTELLAAREATGNRPARVLRFAGAGHNLMRYRPAELSSALLDLLVDAAEAYQRS
jgi:pimeloyl-ACP methyl ester carboxylesterase